MLSLTLFKLGKNIDGKKDFRCNLNIAKFSFFVIARPVLMDEIIAYSSHRGKSVENHNWPLLPQGYVTNKLFDSLVNYLAVMGELEKHKNNLQASSESGLLQRIYSKIEELDFFAGPRTSLEALKKIRITQKFLEGK